MRFIEQILSTIAPHECLDCGIEGTVLCRACSENLPAAVSRCYGCHRSTTSFQTCKKCRATTSLFSVRPVTFYEGTAKDIVWRLKFERIKAGADVIATKLAELSYEPDEVLVNVPTATARVRQRRYDQAALVARVLASRVEIAYSPLLSRLGQARQVGKNRQERKLQMKELFQVVGNVQGKRIILVDDVITTGATLEACAGILKRAGAKQVRAVVFAAA